MLQFNDFILRKDLSVFMNADVSLYEALIDLASRNVTEEKQIFNELLGNLGATAKNAFNAATRTIGNIGSNFSTNYQQSQQKTQAINTIKKVSDLQNDLKKIGFTDQKVQNFLTNVGNVLRASSGQTLNFRGQTFNTNNTSNYNQIANNMRNMVRQGRIQQTGSGSGI